MSDQYHGTNGKHNILIFQMTDEYSRLLTLQQQLEAEADGKVAFFGQSVNETIRTCIINGMLKRADKVKSDFKVPDKRQGSSSNFRGSLFLIFVNSFWYTKLYALTEVRDFEGLDAFSKSKRSPIGYESFVRHLVEKGHSKEAVAYVARCDPPKRADLYAECDEWRMVGKECKDRGDKAKLELVIPLHLAIDRFLIDYFHHFPGNSGRSVQTL